MTADELQFKLQNYGAMENRLLSANSDIRHLKEELASLKEENAKLKEENKRFSELIDIAYSGLSNPVKLLDNK